jgi:hypothetical protein
VKRPGNGEKQTEMMGAREGGFDAPTRWCSYANDDILVPLFGDIIYQTPHQGIFFCALVHTYTHAYMHIHTLVTHIRPDEYRNLECPSWWKVMSCCVSHYTHFPFLRVSHTCTTLRAFLVPYKIFKPSPLPQSVTPPKLVPTVWKSSGCRPTKQSLVKPKKIIVLIIHHAVFIVHRALVNLLLCSNQCLH